MIVWCRECKTNVAPLDLNRCSACVVKPGLGYPQEYTRDFGTYYGVEWFFPEPEWNTVDLKQLRKDRERRKYVTMRGRFG